jgi:hypothetical protein
LTKKYIIFKDDDVGKDQQKLKKWIEIVINNNAKGTIGIIGKYLREKNLVNYLKSLDKEKIEFFCHGFSHNYLPFIIRNIIGRNRIFPTEFDKSVKSHNRSLIKYREYEKIYLNYKTVVFGPPGNTWNKNVVEPLLKNDFKLMFSWRNVGSGILTIPLTDNFKQDNIEDFINDYKKNKDEIIYTLQFHHANLSKEQFKLIIEIIDFLKNEENRIFITPSELIKIKQNNKNVFNIITNNTEL